MSISPIVFVQGIILSKGGGLPMTEEVINPACQISSSFTKAVTELIVIASQVDHMCL